jgi:hypothetical protein
MCKKWIKLDIKRIREYDAKIITCRSCRRILYPFFVHSNIDSHYNCYLCDKSGYITYFCFSCKHKTEPEI